MRHVESLAHRIRARRAREARRALQRLHARLREAQARQKIP